MNEIKKQDAQIGDIAYNFIKRKHVKITSHSILQSVKNPLGDYSRTVFRLKA